MQRDQRNRKTPTRPMIRPIPPAPPRHLAFPGEPEDASAPASDPAPSVSHIARRRVSSAPAHEVQLEDLEIFDESPESQAPQESEREPEEESRLILRATRSPESWQPSSVAPTAMDRLLPPPAEARRRRRGLSLAIAGAVALLVVGVGIGAMLRTGTAVDRPSEPADTGRAAAAREVPAPPSAPPPPATPPPVPVVAVSSLPRSADGTVIGAEGHRLWIDGHLAESFTAVVACGHHVVQVGSAGTPRDVEVPCGEGITVSP